MTQPLITEEQAIENFYREIASYSRHQSHKSRIEMAVSLAQKAHRDQVRELTGEPYLIHPLAVASMLAQRVDDVDTIIAAIIHDTVKDNPLYTMDLIYDTFGSRIGFMVDAVTDSTPYFLKNKSILCNDKIEKIIAWGLHDVGVLLIKLADREHNLATINGLDPKKQIRMSFESQAIYIPLKDSIKFENHPKPLSSYIASLNAFCQTNAITDASSFKTCLMNVMYKDFDDETYLFTYSHSHRVCWTIENKELFYSMIEDEWFANAITIKRMEQIHNWPFFVEFLFVQAMIGNDAISLDLMGVSSDD